MALWTEATSLGGRQVGVECEQLSKNDFLLSNSVVRFCGSQPSWDLIRGPQPTSWILPRPLVTSVVVSMDG